MADVKAWSFQSQFCQPNDTFRLEVKKQEIEGFVQNWA